MTSLLRDLYNNISKEENQHLSCHLDIVDFDVSIKIKSNSFSINLDFTVNEPMHMQEVLNLFVQFKLLEKDVNDNYRAF